MNADRMHSDPNLHDISIDWDDEADGSDGGHDRHGNFVTPSAMKEIVRLRAEVLMLKDQLQTQSKAAKMGMDAARHSAQAMRDAAARLFAQCSPESLESERAANAALTDEVERLRDENERLRLTQVVPDGWQIAPAKPTPEMVSAARATRPQPLSSVWNIPVAALEERRFFAQYQAALAVAPKPGDAQ